MFEIGFRGHANVRSLHRSTIEITREDELGVAGDCIVGVGADCGCSGLPEQMKQKLRDPGSRVRCTILASGMSHAVTGRGHAGLELSHADDIVVRMSGFVCPRTLAVGCDGASDSVPRKMVRALQDPSCRGTLRIEVL
ncbi:uncharacterized protein conserved in archaea [Cenarchaeum symbiosum A]|uniref:Uncharacterized protein conserved in archaea n=1 Tax=Cenarchaeum symbiosum (strain A) TaxID=414004 RepID=A0RWA4_CENSY|nr:uncharacterized protein conserved in archaea [Cenarchaeum symbiosum A]